MLTIFFSQGTGDEWILRCHHETPHPKLFLRSFVEENGILFDEIEYGNDVYFSVKSACLARENGAGMNGSSLRRKRRRKP